MEINLNQTKGKHYVAIRLKDGGYKHFAVEKEVYEYIRQLEFCVRYPHLSKLRLRYPGRFDVHPLDDKPDISVSDLR